jgi:nucleotide-binding universal stress UspA family protein
MKASSSKLTCDQFGKKVDRLLLPIDLAKCPPAIFPLANGFVKPFGGEIILLHVLDRRTKTSLSSDNVHHNARQHLERIGREYLRHTVEANFRIQTGIPHEEISAEATAINADLILLPTFAPSIWTRLTGASYGETERNLPQSAPCLLFVIDVRRRFNCFRSWAKSKATANIPLHDSK